MNKFNTSILIAISVLFVLVMNVSVEAQSLPNYGKMQINDGRLNFVVNPSATMRMSSTQTGPITKTIRFERTETGANFDVISKGADKIQALRIKEKDVAICVVYTNEKDGAKKKKNGIQFSHSIELTALTLNPILAITDTKTENNHVDKPKQYSAVLIQNGSSPIRFLVQTDESTLLEFQTQSLWNLIAIVPPPQRKPLFDLLQIFDASLFPDEQSVMFQIFDAIANIPSVDSNQQNEYQQLVDDLSSDIYIKRLNAMNRIQDAGQAFVQFAKKINLDKLDIEARVCLTRILGNYSNSDMDSTKSLSYQFMGTDYAYTLLLESSKSEYNQLAQKELSQRLGDKFKYEPSADQATRYIQLETIKEALKYPKANVIKMDENVQKQFKIFTDAISDPKKTEFKFNCQ